MRTVVVLSLCLLLAACSQKAERSRSYFDPKLETNLVRADVGAAAPAAESFISPPAKTMPASPEQTDARQIDIPAGAPMLAYSYDYGLEASSGKVRPLIAAHEKACRDAGPTLCQVVGSQVSANGQDLVEGTLTLKAEPKWLDRFRAGLADQAKSAGGRVASMSTETEDLSREMVDTEARLRAMTTLRDRLQALLASRPGKLQELLEVERELARVQGDIDSATSQLAMMRTRVATSAIELHYSTVGALAPEGVFSPLGKAFGDFLMIIVGVLAVLVRLVAVVLPLAVVFGGLAWLLRKRLAKLFRRRPRPVPGQTSLEEKKPGSKPSAP